MRRHWPSLAQSADFHLACSFSKSSASLLAYGHALNEGRALFPGDREFGEWVRLSNLDERNGQEVHPGDRQAAMWAAANADQFEEARQRGNPCTSVGRAGHAVAGFHTPGHGPTFLTGHFLVIRGNAGLFAGLPDLCQTDGASLFGRHLTRGKDESCNKESLHSDASREGVEVSIRGS